MKASEDDAFEEKAVVTLRVMDVLQPAGVGWFR